MAIEFTLSTRALPSLKREVDQYLLQWNASNRRRACKRLRRTRATVAFTCTTTDSASLEKYILAKKQLSRQWARGQLSIDYKYEKKFNNRYFIYKLTIKRHSDMCFNVQRILNCPRLATSFRRKREFCHTAAILDENQCNRKVTKIAPCSRT